jgi:hypothetical protein
MASEADVLAAGVSPRHVWALIPLECQQQIVQLLAHLAVQIIAAQPLYQRADVRAKEQLHVPPSSNNQDPA